MFLPSYCLFFAVSDPDSVIKTQIGIMVVNMVILVLSLGSLCVVCVLETVIFGPLCEKKSFIRMLKHNYA